MDHFYIKNVVLPNPAVRLLKMDNAPLIVSFLYQEFKVGNRIDIADAELSQQLADYLYYLRENNEEGLYPDTAPAYLDRWTADGLLRKYYPASSDEPVFQLTPATEKAMDWIKDLNREEFIGTESRLLRIYTILKDIAYQSTDDPRKKLKELNRQKKEIEREIERVKAGHVEDRNGRKIKELYFEVYNTARRLLADFRQIEYNFRDIDQAVREKQVHANLRKGKLLDEVFKANDLLWNTDQGKSFRAFWEFLLSQQKQDELSALLETVSGLPEVQEVKNDDFLDRIKINLIEAGDRVNKTNHLLIEQLRKFLDSKAHLENKRMGEVIREVQALALKVKDNPPRNADFLLLDDRPFVELVMDRPLFSSPRKVEMTDTGYEAGDQQAIGADQYAKLYTQPFVDVEQLRKRIRQLLQAESQVTLKQVTDAFPVEKGLAEVVAYYSIAAKDKKSLINDDVQEQIRIANAETDKQFEVTFPQVIFCK
jgi:hypothetical protein